MEWAALRYVRESAAFRGSASVQLPEIGVASPDECSGLPEGWEVPLFVWDPLPLFAELAGICAYPGPGISSNFAPGTAPVAVFSRGAELSYLFHRRMAEAVCAGVEIAGKETGLTAVCLGGGVFQNMLLRYLLKPMLEERGFTVFTNVRVSPGDGGLALGQVYWKQP